MQQLHKEKYNMTVSSRSIYSDYATDDEKSSESNKEVEDEGVGATEDTCLCCCLNF